MEVATKPAMAQLSLRERIVKATSTPRERTDVAFRVIYAILYTALAIAGIALAITGYEADDHKCLHI